MPVPDLLRRSVAPCSIAGAAALLLGCARGPERVADLEGTWLLAGPPAEPGRGRAASFRVDAGGRVLLPGQPPVAAVLFGDTLFVAGPVVASGGVRMLVDADSLVLLSDGTVYRRRPASRAPGGP